MKIFRVLLVACGATFGIVATSAIAAPPVKHVAKPLSLCTPPAEILFSCPTAHGGKVISMCAVKDAVTGRHRFYYAFGRPHRPEFVFPEKGQSSDGVFSQAHLLFAGATVGHTFIFAHGGYKYVVYSIEGTGFRDGGVLVQQGEEDNLWALKDIKCRASGIVETQDDALINEVVKWKHDPGIEAHNLPHVPRTH